MGTADVIEYRKKGLKVSVISTAEGNNQEGEQHIDIPSNWPES